MKLADLGQPIARGGVSERAKPVVAAVRLALPHPATSDETLGRIIENRR